MGQKALCKIGSQKKRRLNATLGLPIITISQPSSTPNSSVELDAIRSNSSEASLSLSSLTPRKFDYGHKEEKNAIFPIDKKEKHAALEHQVVRMAANRIFYAPLQETYLRSGVRILDLGCGSGDWVMDMARSFPLVHVFGLDINKDILPPEHERPPNCTFITSDALGGLPFSDATFDFVFQKCLAQSWTKEQWNFILGEMTRVLKPGGYVELWEMDYQIHRNTNPGPLELALLAATKLKGLDPWVARRLTALLTTHNLRKISSTYVSIPFSWGGELGRLYEESFLRPCFQGVKSWLRPLVGVDGETYDQFVGSLEKRVNEVEGYMNWHIAYGMKRRASIDERRPKDIITKSKEAKRLVVKRSVSANGFIEDEARRPIFQ